MAGRKKGDPDAPNAPHAHEPSCVKATSEPDSTVLARTWRILGAKCHSDAGFLSRHQIPWPSGGGLQQSVHGAVANGNEKAAILQQLPREPHITRRG